ncbi:hypothetical protein B0I31_12045 [Saccharothrix carnea]|uniref:Uncharacterized protein n=1 Tax=Saccharothrix carnea TaxID=1280637 RepID=A0A2P8HZ88_SACCR|nr:hypothetical protein [Saccharothrix carnea]PSL51515.1 hypothetical protein B0I31_12045 [Saccharothrix carnea]
MAGNLLIRGGDGDTLRSLNGTGQYQGMVKSAYLRPSWDTQWGFECHEPPGPASWLSMLQEYVRVVGDLLAPGGSV